MAETDLHCWVGTYEIRRASELPKDSPMRRAHERGWPNEPFLVELSQPAQKFPTPAEWDMAVLRLLKTELPFGRSKLSLELEVEAKRRGIAFNSDAYRELWEKKLKVPRGDWAPIQKAALEISSHLGMLRPGSPPNKADKFRAEHLRSWVSCADRIQALFFGQQAAQELT